MTGAEMNARILELLAQYNVYGHHNPDSRRAIGRGFPDWVFIGRRILYRELKGSNDTLSMEQRAVGRWIGNAAGDWGVWWPKDLRPEGRAERELRSIAT